MMEDAEIEKAGILVLDKCRVCGGGNGRLHSVSSELPIHIWPLPAGKKNAYLDAGHFVCGDCGHVQLQSMSDEFIDFLYEEEYFVLEDSALDKHRIQSLVDIFGREVIEGARLLDVGGGNNPIAGPVSELGYKCESWVVDINPKPLAAEVATKVVRGRFEDAELPQGYFDLATSFFSMEHFNNPPEIIARMAEVLKPGGLVAVEVPNLSGLIDFAPHYLTFHQHVSIFSVSSLDNLFSLQGFRRKTMIHEDAAIYLVYENVHGPKELSAPGIDPWVEMDRFRARMADIGSRIQALELPEGEGKIGIYAAGGSTSLFLANFPWLRERISMAFDRDTRKHGRVIPGSQIKVHGPQDIDSSGIEILLFLDDGIHKAVSPDVRVKCLSLGHILSIGETQ